MMTTASLLLRALLFSAALLSINGLAAVRKSMFHGTSLVSSTPAPTAVRRTATASSITMRKQKASDKRTRKRQRGDFLVDEQAVSAAAVVASATTLTSSPMSAAGPWQHKATTLPLQLKQQDILLESSGASGVRPKKKTPGRGRSRKRSTLYNSLAFYHNKFLHLLTAEYQAEEDEVLGRIKASVDDPLGLETAGYALYDLYAERRGNLFTDEVYRLTKAKDATTVYPRSNIIGDDNDKIHDSLARYLPPNHKFKQNDCVMLTLQPAGSGDFFDPVTTQPTSDKAVTAECRVLNIGPTYVDIAVPAGGFEAAFGPAPNDLSGTGDKSMRLRADRFFSNVPYQRMVAALAQISSIPENQSSKKSSVGEEKTAPPPGGKNPHENIVMDPLLREAVLSTHAFTDPNSPLLRDPDVCDLHELSAKLSKPPMATSLGLASQAIKYLKQNPHEIFDKFNAPQLAAIQAALTRRMTMIQGPPGTGKTTVAAAIGFGFCHQSRTISPNAKVLACAFSNVGADNLAEALQRLGLKVVRVGKASAVSQALWPVTLDAAIDADPAALKAIQNAARATAQLAKSTRNGKRGPNTGALSERTLREAATAAVKASIQACNIAATKALRQADVIVSTSTGAADPRLLAACGIVTAADEASKDSQQKSKTHVAVKASDLSALARTDAPDGLAPLSLPFVIVDEACQSVEPATLIPVTASNSCRSLVMLGDPCQLPPTVRSADATPLSVSLMERLAMTLPVPSVSSPVDSTLKDTSFLDTLAVKQAMSSVRSRERGERQQSSYRKRFAGSLLLSIQYRMHPSIAAFPSAIFYDGLLSTPSFMSDQRSFPRVLNSMMPCGNPSICVRMIDVGGRGNERRGMPSRFTRTVFGSVAPSALEEQTSYWNEPEAQRVVALIKDILTDDDPEVKTIGIITPYNAQVQLIKGMIASDRDLQEMLGRLPATIEVKSVDGYQGRERDLIIFSAVRSNRQGTIGFLHDWRRMNVALTRAKNGLVVLGDLTTLSEADKHWDALTKWAAGVRCIVDDWDSPEDEPSI